MEACPFCEGTGKVESYTDRRRFGQQMRQRRLNAKVTLREISEKTGYSVSYLSDLEQGRKFWNDNLRQLYKDAIGQLIKA